ncbi:hypothetical protein NIES4071_79580 [Calothrix sp. NIES-4071]|nr:hypothetical protein NIES4071_79580 [Calothrix sp. NIES-4071]BAZ62228.1 hypothetical protein NIES4105_79510 [Calothrix sp. NIES-4105]
MRVLLTVEAVSGTLNDLTPEQIKIFDEAVEGKIASNGSKLIVEGFV